MTSGRQPQWRAGPTPAWPVTPRNAGAPAMASTTFICLFKRAVFHGLINRPLTRLGHFHIPQGDSFRCRKTPAPLGRGLNHVAACVGWPQYRPRWPPSGTVHRVAHRTQTSCRHRASVAGHASYWVTEENGPGECRPPSPSEHHWPRLETSDRQHGR